MRSQQQRVPGGLAVAAGLFARFTLPAICSTMLPTMWFDHPLFATANEPADSLGNFDLPQ